MFVIHLICVVVKGNFRCHSVAVVVTVLDVVVIRLSLRFILREQEF
jgi:hypothetical protein